MKTWFNFLFVLVILGMSACTSSGKKDQKPMDGKQDSTAMETQKATPVPGQQDSVYNPNTIDPNIARLVQLTMNDLYKEDLAKDLISKESRQFIFYQYDLNGDGKKEIFVGLRGSYFCGSGGCTVLLLDYQGNLIDQFTVVDYPIVIDNQKTNNWDNLFMMSGGEFHLMKFNGQKYPQNPSVEPVVKVAPASTLPRILDFINEPYKWFSF